MIEEVTVNLEETEKQRPLMFWVSQNTQNREILINYFTNLPLEIKNKLINNNSPLHWALFTNDIDEMHRLLKNKLSLLYAPSANGRTALYYAALLGNVNAMNVLNQYRNKDDSILNLEESRGKIDNLLDKARFSISNSVKNLYNNDAICLYQEAKFLIEEQSCEELLELKGEICLELAHCINSGQNTEFAINELKEAINTLLLLKSTNKRKILIAQASSLYASILLDNKSTENPNEILTQLKEQLYIMEKKKPTQEKWQK